MEKLITIKESQRKLIWKANHLFAAAQAVEAVALSDEAYHHLASGLEAAARSLVLQAGFEDAPTCNLIYLCQTLCDDYVTGKLEVIPFE